MKTIYKIECKTCGNTWHSDFDDLDEWCDECTGDDLKIIDEVYIDSTCCPECEGLWTLGHLTGCAFNRT